MRLHYGSSVLDLDSPCVMGVLNVTPDSFSDGGAYAEVEQAVARGKAMLAEGARIIDVGGESTRPGAAPVDAAEEIRRVLPVVTALANIGCTVSIDTSKAEVIRAAFEAGAALINDVRALQEPGALRAAAATRAAVCLMHMRGEPATMQQQPRYRDVVSEVSEFLAERIRACVAAGIDSDRLLVDPGIGFGKSVEHNLNLLARLSELRTLGRPLLIGVSRKSTIGALTGRDVNQRLHGGLAFATAAVLAGAQIIRTHDVAATVDAVKVATVLRDQGYKALPQVEAEC